MLQYATLALLHIDLAATSATGGPCVGKDLRPSGEGDPPHNVQSLCSSWRDATIREGRARPYIRGAAGIARVSPDAACDELDAICEMGAARSQTPSDIVAYQALGLWLQAHRGQQSIQNPLGDNSYKEQADAVESCCRNRNRPGRRCWTTVVETVVELSRRGVTPEDLHCIELHDTVPNEHRGKFELHLLKATAPVDTLHELSKNVLHEVFDVVPAFDVFHHISDAVVRDATLLAIYEMTKPGGFFLLNDWDSHGRRGLGAWYDAAHIVLWMFMGMRAPAEPIDLDLGTAYYGASQWATLAQRQGFVTDVVAPSRSDASPLGAFSQVLQRPALPSNTSAVRGWDDTGAPGGRYVLLKGGLLRGVGRVQRHSPRSEPH